MKRPIALLASLLAVTVLATAATAAGGDSSDPLISLNYLQTTFTTKATSSIDAALDKSDQAAYAKAEAALRSTIAAAEANVGAQRADVFTESRLKQGDILSGTTGLQVIVLAGKTVQFASDWPIAGAPPDGITAGDDPDFALTLCPAGDALHLVPRIGVLGVGCKRGTSAETLAEAFAAFCAQNRLAPQCITAAASIDLKQNEAGLLTFCKSHSWPVQFFTAEHPAYWEDIEETRCGHHQS